MILGFVSARDTWTLPINTSQKTRKAKRQNFITNQTNPDRPVVCNVDVTVVEDANAGRDALVRQVTGSVKWQPSVRLMIDKGVTTFVEVGPGKVLWGLMRQIDRGPTSLYVGDESSLQKSLEHIGNVAA